VFGWAATKKELTFYDLIAKQFMVVLLMAAFLADQALKNHAQLPLFVKKNYLPYVITGLDLSTHNIHNAGRDNMYIFHYNTPRQGRGDGFRNRIQSQHSNLWFSTSWGQCYDHNFLRFSTIFGEKIGVFFKNQCYDQNFA
jgi:hypothetical protein